jgi:putative ABC transport system permease protein
LTGYLVAQRTHEIGVRMALGASRVHLAEAVLRPAALALIVGLAVGMSGAATLGAIMRSDLAGLSPLDPATYAAATAIFTAVMVLAALAPARRAMRVNPSDALRHE